MSLLQKKKADSINLSSFHFASYKRSSCVLDVLKQKCISIFYLEIYEEIENTTHSFLLHTMRTKVGRVASLMSINNVNRHWFCSSIIHNLPFIYLYEIKEITSLCKKSTQLLLVDVQTKRKSYGGYGSLEYENSWVWLLMWILWNLCKVDTVPLAS